MATRPHELPTSSGSGSLDDFVVSRKLVKATSSSSERNFRALEREDDEEKLSDIESTLIHARFKSRDQDKRRPDSKDVHPVTKKRKPTTSSSSEVVSKQYKSAANDRSSKQPSVKRSQADHDGHDPSSPSPRESYRHQKAKASPHASETKAESSKLVGAFVQTVEKVLNQFDGEKDRDAAFKKLQKDYLALLNVRQTEPEKLLAESNRLAKEAKALHAEANTKLRQQVANLTKKVEKYDKVRENIERIKARTDIGANDSEVVVTLKHENAIIHAENDSLRNRVKNLERELELERSKHLSTTAPSPAEVRRLEGTATDLTHKLVQANKLLGIYELLSSLHINLKSSSDDKVEVSCRAIDSLDAKQFSFNVAIPTNPRDQLEYSPSMEEVDHQKRQAAPLVPDFLLDELSFQRSELTRFMRTILEAVIRKK
ncbi:hypothetical protein, variant [Aphanomyces invadans]|uniref:Monopolin complex subunit Csm1/Pcs1 C-terminal domain-containing protein n=1 Tax=Aphanomyces invadans TaxID=157072 RepID=A0A024USU7_9STRA|nr:hypothetical protein, variant [Aphanomyces invadans]ETW08987.1 hypothetical protein, variant [Aphanomyces invadans]|eukprot:XP_008862792.1 hypothetical protein, variant [Aphanomyces invadans]